MLDISPELLIATLVVFLTLIAILNSWLYRPLFAYINKREEDIKNDLDHAGSNDDEISTLELKANAIIEEAKQEAAVLRERVVGEASALAKSKIEVKRAELAKQYAEFEVSLAKTKEQLRDELKSQLPIFQDAIKAKLSTI
ncbi:MAG: FoF1 ATP synthase subunit B' [Sulfuricurvum sp.]